MFTEDVVVEGGAVDVGEVASVYGEIDGTVSGVSTTVVSISGGVVTVEFGSALIKEKIH